VDGHERLPDGSVRHGAHDACARAVAGDRVRIVFVMWTAMMVGMMVPSAVPSEKVLQRAMEINQLGAAHDKVAGLCP
jgi:predicted metal-binding membrane protein